ncbi:Gfo/Idh/MocA family protein [Paenibacillus puldeungensis]|uniref:Gfo/Idh/MocA family protein n=1 Tax=Paenibacillus puldeungensis TaxID=696536 RepID=A0ABW3RXR5_9BACL
MKVGILGTGFGAYHASIYKKLPSVESITIFGRNEQKLFGLRGELGVNTTTEIDDILNDPDIGLVDVCLPNRLHCEYIQKALAKGKHVFCETKVCETMDEAAAIRKAELESGKRVFVDLFIKFDPAYRLIYDAIQQNLYGELKAIHLKRNTAAVWGKLGFDTIVTNLMIHELDFITWILGMPREVAAAGSSSNDREACVSALLTYDGVMVELAGSSMLPKSYPFTVGYEAIFEHGALHFYEQSSNEGTQQQLIEYTPGGKSTIDLPSVNPYEESIKHVLDCCVHGSESMLSMDKASASLQLALDIKKLLPG